MEEVLPVEEEPEPMEDSSSSECAHTTNSSDGRGRQDGVIEDLMQDSDEAPMMNLAENDNLQHTAEWSSECKWPTGFDGFHLENVLLFCHIADGGRWRFLCHLPTKTELGSQPEIVLGCKSCDVKKVPENVRVRYCPRRFLVGVEMDCTAIRCRSCNHQKRTVEIGDWKCDLPKLGTCQSVLQVLPAADYTNHSGQLYGNNVAFRQRLQLALDIWPLLAVLVLQFPTDEFVLDWSKLLRCFATLQQDLELRHKARNMAFQMARRWLKDEISRQSMLLKATCENFLYRATRASIRQKHAHDLELLISLFQELPRPQELTKVDRPDWFNNTSSIFNEWRTEHNRATSFTYKLLMNGTQWTQESGALNWNFLGLFLESTSSFILPSEHDKEDRELMTLLRSRCTALRSTLFYEGDFKKE